MEFVADIDILDTNPRSGNPRFAPAYSRGGFDMLGEGRIHRVLQRRQLLEHDYNMSSQKVIALVGIGGIGPDAFRIVIEESKRVRS